MQALDDGSRSCARGRSTARQCSLRLLANAGGTRLLPPGSAVRSRLALPPLGSAIRLPPAVHGPLPPRHPPGPFRSGCAARTPSFLASAAACSARMRRSNSELPRLCGRLCCPGLPAGDLHCCSLFGLGGRSLLGLGARLTVGVEVAPLDIKAARQRRQCGIGRERDEIGSPGQSVAGLDVHGAAAFENPRRRIRGVAQDD